MTNANKTCVAVTLAAVFMTGCATGQSASFATRVNAGSSGVDAFEATRDEASEIAVDASPDFLAGSGNVLLPGAFSGPPRSDTLLAGLQPSAALPGLNSGGQTPAFNALVGGAVGLTLNGADGPQLTVDGNVDAAVTGLGANPVLSSLAPVTQGLSPVTQALAPLTGAVQGAGPLVSAGGQGTSIAGQPLASLGGVGSVLSGTASAAGSATSGAGSIVVGVAPAVSTVVNAAGQAVTTPPVPGSTPSPVPGLGGLNSLLPRLR